ncbi:MAG TPA: SUF system NifU family Fe-S cluster assembly protein [Ruania sp.]|nr:SUF system NifU family Fe-S cluster assembly protein [Ruania sp.]
MNDAMTQLYQQVILDHARERHGYGLVAGHAGESFQVNPTCGDEIRLRVHLDITGPAPVIERVSWEGMGCSISQASASVLTDLVRGADVARADQLAETFRELMNSRGRSLAAGKDEMLGDAAAFTGVAQYPARIKCALLGWMALRDALAHAVTQAPPAEEKNGMNNDD